MAIKFRTEKFVHKSTNEEMTRDFYSIDKGMKIDALGQAVVITQEGMVDEAIIKDFPVEYAAFKNPIIQKAVAKVLEDEKEEDKEVKKGFFKGKSK